jgi:hypothetical protein
VNMTLGTSQLNYTKMIYKVFNWRKNQRSEQGILKGEYITVLTSCLAGLD